MNAMNIGSVAMSLETLSKPYSVHFSPDSLLPIRKVSQVEHHPRQRISHWLNSSFQQVSHNVDRVDHGRFDIKEAVRVFILIHLLHEYVRQVQGFVLHNERCQNLSKRWISLPNQVKLFTVPMLQHGTFNQLLNGRGPSLGPVDSSQVLDYGPVKHSFKGNQKSGQSPGDDPSSTGIKAKTLVKPDEMVIVQLFEVCDDTLQRPILVLKSLTQEQAP